MVLPPFNSKELFMIKVAPLVIRMVPPPLQLILLKLKLPQTLSVPPLIVIASGDALNAPLPVKHQVPPVIISPSFTVWVQPEEQFPEAGEELHWAFKQAEAITFSKRKKTILLKIPNAAISEFACR